MGGWIRNNADEPIEPLLAVYDEVNEGNFDADSMYYGPPDHIDDIDYDLRTVAGDDPNYDNSVLADSMSRGSKVGCFYSVRSYSFIRKHDSIFPIQTHFPLVKHLAGGVWLELGLRPIFSYRLMKYHFELTIVLHEETECLIMNVVEWSAFMIKLRECSEYSDADRYFPYTLNEFSGKFHFNLLDEGGISISSFDYPTGEFLFRPFYI